MTDGKKVTGFMPRRISLNTVPSSYSLKFLTKDSTLELEKIWDAQEKERHAKLAPLPQNSDLPAPGEEAA